MRRARADPSLALATGLMLLLAVPGCRSTGAPVPSGQRSEAFVRVENRSMLDMTVYPPAVGQPLTMFSS